MEDSAFKKYESLIKEHFEIIKKCAIYDESSQRAALLATAPGSRYPYFYPRDAASASHLLNTISLSGFSYSDEAYALLREVANFALYIQREDGHWGQRYGTDGTDKSIYIQEDNVAHGMIIVSNYILASLDRGEEVGRLQELIGSLNKAAIYALEHNFRREINLFFSTTSIHESAGRPLALATFVVR